MPSTSPVKKRDKIILIVVLVALASGIGTAAFLYFRNHSGTDLSEQATSLDKSEAQKERERELLSDPSKKTENQADVPPQPIVDPSTGKQIVTVMITDAGMYDGKVEARGFVTNTVEQEGVCVYTFKKGGSTLSRQVSTLPNATSTTCQTVVIDVSELSTGMWTVVLEYSSTTSYGKSTTREFIIP